jgi:large subunit ribosomal protein L32
VALPKRRHSKTRQAKRRTHWKAKTSTVTNCSHCGQPKRPHRVCPTCGYYAGEEITPDIA